MNNLSAPLNGHTPMEHIHFLLDCFVVSVGPEPPQLGRYHPQSNPEEFVQKDDYYDDRSNKEDAQSSLMSEENDLFDNYFPSTIIANRADSRRRNYESPDDMIVRELSEMRLVLERLLDNHDVIDWDHPAGFRDVLQMLPHQPLPHYPVGDWEFHACGICLDSQWLYRRACCFFPACSNCLQIYFSQKIEMGQVKIECCNSECHAYVHRDEISARLTKTEKEKFNKLLVLANQDANSKTCPRCSHLTKIASKNKKDNKFPRIVCPSCHLEWCFNCHAPWHGVFSCKQFQKGDRLLRAWAREKNNGQINAQKCPKCKVYIQRTTGCDHMHCTRCKTDFCYKCGERFRYLKFFGDHYSKLSIFGCRYRFKADHALQRKMIRGAIFGGKLMAAPALGALAVCAGAVAIGISIFALPIYGGVRLFKYCEERQTAKIVLRYPPTCHIPNLHLSHSFP